MAHIGYIDKEAHAAKAVELLEGRKDSFISYAYTMLSAGTSNNAARDSLVKNVKSKMKYDIFEHLKRSGAIQKDVRYDFSRGYCRMRYIEPSPGDVPSRLLDVSILLPNFQEIINSIMIEASKRKMVADIEAVTKAALEGAEVKL